MTIPSASSTPSQKSSVGVMITPRNGFYQQVSSFTINFKDIPVFIASYLQLTAIHCSPHVCGLLYCSSL